VYVLKAAIEKAGKVDRQLVAQTMKGLSLKAAQHPGVLMDVSFDANGDLDRESFLVEARDGKQIVKEILPALGAK
jgi:branched-chain amino acid transport system substrate-binding protein